MKSKYLIGIGLIFIILLTCGCVNAKMQEHDFEHYFSMDVPKNSNFEKLEGKLYDNLPFEETDYVDSKNNIVIGYISDSMVSEDNVDCNYNQLFKLINPKLKECFEYQEGNIKVLEPKKKSNENFAVVGLHQDNDTIIIIGNDVDTLKEMAHSVKFN